MKKFKLLLVSEVAFGLVVLFSCKDNANCRSCEIQEKKVIFCDLGDNKISFKSDGKKETYDIPKGLTYV